MISQGGEEEEERKAFPIAENGRFTSFVLTSITVKMKSKSIVFILAEMTNLKNSSFDFRSNTKNVQFKANKDQFYLRQM